MGAFYRETWWLQMIQHRGHWTTWWEWKLNCSRCASPSDRLDTTLHQQTHQTKDCPSETCSFDLIKSSWRAIPVMWRQDCLSGNTVKCLGVLLFCFFLRYNLFSKSYHSVKSTASSRDNVIILCYLNCAKTIHRFQWVALLECVCVAVFFKYSFCSNSTAMLSP